MNSENSKSALHDLQKKKGLSVFANGLSSFLDIKNMLFVVPKMFPLYFTEILFNREFLVLNLAH